LARCSGTLSLFHSAAKQSFGRQGHSQAGAWERGNEGRPVPEWRVSRKASRSGDFKSPTLENGDFKSPLLEALTEFELKLHCREDPDGSGKKLELGNEDGRAEIA
jgi:hypothetical protein